MAKEKRSAADLDAELAALEAELAALEGKPKKKVEKPAKKKEAPEPAAAPVSPAPAEEQPEPAKEKKGRFAMPKMAVPKFGKKQQAEPEPPMRDAGHAPAPAAAAAPELTPASTSGPADDTPVSELAVAPQKAFDPQPQYDLSLWRQEGDAWVRVVPETPLPVVRRVLDENGNVVREESAQKRDVESVGSVRAERGLGRLLRRKG